jgi:hypothetical protein
MQRFAQRRVTVIGAPPKCSEHKLALQFVRVEISQDIEVSDDEVVADVCRCPHPGSDTEQFSRHGRRLMKSGK